VQNIRAILTYQDLCYGFFWITYILYRWIRLRLYRSIIGLTRVWHISCTAISRQLILMYFCRAFYAFYHADLHQVFVMSVAVRDNYCIRTACQQCLTTENYYEFVRKSQFQSCWRDLSLRKAHATILNKNSYKEQMAKVIWRRSHRIRGAVETPV